MPQNNNSQNNKEAGNVFIIILVAVVLFGALIFTFSRSGSQGVSSISKQEAKIAAQEILSYARLVEGAVDRVRRNGCSESEISFKNDVNLNYTNPNAPIDKSCHIFEPEGGKIEFFVGDSKIYLSATNPLIFSGGNRIIDVGSTNLDLILIIVTTDNICNEIHKSLNIEVTSTLENIALLPFTGDFTPSATPDIGDENTSLQGLHQFCLKPPSGSREFFTSVLLAR